MEEVKIDKIIRTRRRTIALIVSADATVIVRAPMRVSSEYIEKLVFQKRVWIAKRKKQVLENGGLVKAKNFVDGEDFLYLGEVYKLKINSCHNIELADYLYFPEEYSGDSRAKMIEWYKQKAKEKIIERVNFYSDISGWKYKSISITNAKKRWGSCGPTGSLNFSWRLIMAPLDVIDYVVVHELAHIPEKNHSSRFWDKVRVVLPGYKNRKKWLRENGNNLII
jgi:predicted metal-dependent hydrolase